MKSALLVIDIQNLPVEDQPYAIAERLRLWQNSLAQARQAGIEVIHVRHHDQELVKGTADWEIHPFVAPLENEMIFDKTFNSAFKETGLHAYLQEKEIEQLIIMGIATNFCIDTTIKVAFELGYKVAVIQDGTTTGYSGKLDAKDLIDHYQNIWSWNFAQVDKLENIIRG
ncbi:cysteine hydrolase family protein [Streptococcus suis]|uniref:cysteine hydrolase family protein n=1 Tax=Streptococcus suis TaxID=1307 RepID=UPI0009457BB5|nr:cysteine hydrolase family protein [Streptococcus suis]WNF74071.1 cysteine hydrolase family protein [Streptococcus suis]HEL1667832.1 cysteine hydrolase [Streptococcus suis]HEM2533869.1 cysteine hydrolase [Streptococcus suis]HEM2552455.1 cysteine hydrolase [Streptococcus suis]HEM2558383.1 cysteine hydrolase [Streptococcus suis]